MMVAEPGRAAFVPPYQTNFEIDGNTAVNGVPPAPASTGPTRPPPSRGTRTTTEPATGKNEDTLGGDSLNTLDTLRPVVVQDANVTNKVDLCNAYAAWEAITVGTQLHYILYSAWQRNPSQTGQASFLIPLIPANATSNADVRLLQFDYDSAGGTTTASLRRYTGSGWNKTLLVDGFQPAIAPVSPADFGEFAIDLTRTGIIPADAPCTRFVAAYAFTQTGNSDNALLKDYVGFSPAMQVDTWPPPRSPRSPIRPPPARP